jgi:hypothetical protein
MKKSLLLAAAFAAFALAGSAFAMPPPGDHDVQAAPASHAVVKQEQAAAVPAVQAPLAVSAQAQGSSFVVTPESASGEFVLTVYPARAVSADPTGIARRERWQIWT